MKNDSKEVNPARSLYAQVKALIPEADNYCVNVGAQSSKMGDGILVNFTVRARLNDQDLAYGYGYTAESAIVNMMAYYEGTGDGYGGQIEQRAEV